MGTSFSVVYDSFLDRVTSDMYMELTELDTLKMLQELLVNSIPRFEFPRFNSFDYELGSLQSLGTYQGEESGGAAVPAFGWIGGVFSASLTQEEVNILSLCMLIEWLGQQIATTENTRMKYSGADFRFSSQASHLSKLKVLVEHYKQDCFHLQRLYKRRVFVDGEVKSTIGNIMTSPVYGYKVN